jgi:uncharacterized protein YgiM (DUF1202 family)
MKYLLDLSRVATQMKNKLVGLFLGSCLSLNITSFSAPALAATCAVTDPTGTALNVRKSPNGKVIGSIDNDKNVRIIAVSTDKKGRAWAKIRGDSGATGWVLREFVSCY